MHSTLSDLYGQAALVEHRADEIARARRLAAEGVARVFRCSFEDALGIVDFADRRAAGVPE